jgi:hypothetical protein
MHKKDIEGLTELRIRDAKVLLETSSWSAAYYLSGYSIELALKACISKQFSAETIPDKSFVNDVFSHEYVKLIGLAGLQQSLNAKLKSDKAFAANWGICREWSPNSRYATWDESDARYLYSAITDEQDGVLSWIKMHW